MLDRMSQQRRNVSGDHASYDSVRPWNRHLYQQHHHQHQQHTDRHDRCQDGAVPQPDHRHRHDLVVGDHAVQHDGGPESSRKGQGVLHHRDE